MGRMADAVITDSSNPSGGTTTQTPPNPNGDTSQNPQGGASANPGGDQIDYSKLDVNKLLENDDTRKAILGHDRFKGLQTKAARADQLEQETAAREEAALKESGKYKELYEKSELERTSTIERYAKLEQDSAIQAAAAKVGITDYEVALAIIDRSGIKSDDGKLVGVDEAVAKLAESKPYLVSTNQGQPQKRMGSSSANPPADGSPATFTASQIRDRKFYLENQDAIDKAFREGRIDSTR